VPKDAFRRSFTLLALRKPSQLRLIRHHPISDDLIELDRLGDEPMLGCDAMTDRQWVDPSGKEGRAKWGMRLQYFQEFFEPSSIEEVRFLLHDLSSRRARTAFWLWEDNRPVLGLFLNGNNAILCYEPTLAWSKATGYEGDPEATMQFELENGQLDDLPQDSVVSFELGIAAVLDYFEHGRLSDNIEWQ
jgi:hypothetical protein